MRKSKLLLFFLPFFLFSCGGLDNPLESENTSSTTEIEIEKGELFDGLSTELVFNDVFEYSFSTKYSGQREFVAQGCNIELYQINENKTILDNEILRSISEDAIINNKIDSEKLRAQEEEQKLNTRIDENLTSIVSVEPSSSNILEEYHFWLHKEILVVLFSDKKLSLFV